MTSKHLPYRPITKARYRRTLEPSRPSPAVLRLIRVLSPLYLRFALRCTAIELHNENRHEPNELITQWNAFQQGKTRLILAFRHPYGDEAQIFSFLFDILLKKQARREGVILKGHPHARFIHGYEVALWGGSLIRWLLPRIGALPVYHVKADSSGIKTIRSVIKNGPHPIALAPEGQVSYRSETVPRLESGSAQMGFWCAEELDREKRAEQVCILPLSVHHIFDPKDEHKILGMIRTLEQTCTPDIPDQSSIPVHERLEALDARILSMAEDFYRNTYGKEVTAGTRDARWAALRQIALLEGEHALGIGAHQSTDEIQRVYRLRQECWDRIYSLDPGRKIGTLERAYLDRRAGEAWFAMRHMEFADIAYYLDSGYLASVHRELPSFNRIAETVLNLGDLVSRFAGGNISHRATTLRKKAIIISGRSLEIRERLRSYRENRRLAVQEVTEEMKTIFLECIAALKSREAQ